MLSNGVLSWSEFVKITKIKIRFTGHGEQAHAMLTKMGNQILRL